MGRIEKTVFISYRRTNLPWALAIYQNLTAHGYDVFFDYQSINSGDFEQIILGNIRARAHFLVLLTPSALERCNESGDWLRREIETALDQKRNIVPLFFEGFDFGSPEAIKALSGKLALLKNYNGLRFHSDYFEEGMLRLRQRFLNIALDAVLHPVSPTVKTSTTEQQVKANKSEPVKLEDLTAQEWFEKGVQAIDLDEGIRFYTEAIHLQSNYAQFFLNRGTAYGVKGDLDRAIADYDEAIRIQPDDALAYKYRAIIQKYQGNLDDAMKDFIVSIRLNPDDVDTRIGYLGILQKLEKYSEASEQRNEILVSIQNASKYSQACFESFSGNLDRAIELLKIAIIENRHRKTLARINPDFDNIRDDPRFKEIVGE